MPRRRRYTRRTRIYRPLRYSNETSQLHMQLDFAARFEGKQVNNGRIIDSITQQGMRKVKNFTINLACQFTPTSAFEDAANDFIKINPFLYWAVVYVPENQEPGQLLIENGREGGSIYEPNQNLIIGGIATINGQAITRSTRLARNLNSGDRIGLVCATNSTNGGPLVDTKILILATCNYAIAY